MRKVCVDVDGTIVNFHEGVRRCLAENGITYYPEKCTDYNFGGDIGCDRRHIFNLFHDVRLYESLPFFENAKKAVELLLEHCDEVHGYTASVKDEPIFNRRVDFVEELGMHPDVYVDRKPAIDDADALFDDCLGVHRTWIEADSKAKLYLIDQPHNRITEENKNDPIWNRVIRCNSLFDAVMKYLEF